MDKMKKLDYFSDAVIDSQYLSDLQGGQGVETEGGQTFKALSGAGTTSPADCDWDPQDGGYKTYYWNDGTFGGQYTGPGK